MILFVATAMLTLPLSASAEKPDASSQSAVDRLIQAIQSNDRSKFLEGATDEMKSAITPDIMQRINEELSPHLEKGFETSYLTDLKQQGCTVKLWKISFKDGSDDVVLRIVMKDEKLAGFFKQ